MSIENPFDAFLELQDRYTHTLNLIKSVIFLLLFVARCVLFTRDMALFDLYTGLHPY